MIELASEPKPMKRIIGLLSGILMVPGIIIGTGIFKELAPMAAGHLSDNTIIVVWVAAGIVTLLGALSVSALSSLTTESGGEYEYLKVAFGKFAAFIFGWTSFVIIGSASVAAMSMIVMQSLKDLLPSAVTFSASSWKILACALIMLITFFNIISTRSSIGFNNLLTFFKFAGLFLLIFGGFYFYQQLPEHVLHSEVAQDYVTGLNLFKPFVAAMMSAFWAYDGWLSIAFMGGEMKNPKKNLPLSIIIGVLIVMVLYVLVNMAILRVIPASSLAQMSSNDIAATEMSQMVFGKIGNTLMSLLILICTLGALNGIIITYSRMYYKMSIDGLFFKHAGMLHRRFETPYVALLLAMCVSCILVFAGTFEVLTNVIVFAGYFFYALLAFATIKLTWNGRIQTKHPAYLIASVIFILFSGCLLISTIISTPLQMGAGIGVMLLGAPMYLYFKWSNRKTEN